LSWTHRFDILGFLGEKARGDEAAQMYSRRRDRRRTAHRTARRMTEARLGARLWGG
jgi:hypothetical protein